MYDAENNDLQVNDLVIVAKDNAAYSARVVKLWPDIGVLEVKPLKKRVLGSIEVKRISVIVYSTDYRDMTNDYVYNLLEPRGEVTY